ncbi:hypothetical protein [Lysinibacillus capsici]|uniref:hypothetical protein n=1 Tax=Lysinibacillus capsici TaxID=2115968 RepID=UPI003BA8F892
MNWDILIGFAAGISGSIITLVGNYINNRQNHKFEIKKNLQNLTLEQSFKEYEIKTNMAKEYEKQGKSITIYPYSLHLVYYSKFAEYLSKENRTDKDLEKLLREVESYTKVYDENSRREKF